MTDAYIMAVALLSGFGQLFAIAAGMALAAWVTGGVVLRFSGRALAFVGLGAAALAHLVGLLLAVLGAVLWVAGHWLYALRHHTYKSPLARRVFLDLLPERADPTRHWIQTD